MWRLRVIPRIKVFIWKLAHGKPPTGAYLYDLNIGPYSPCYFCELDTETANHVIWTCSKVNSCWSMILDFLGLSHLNQSFLNSGLWLTSTVNLPHKIQFDKALIGTSAWLIWKERCNLVFKKWRPNFNTILDRALSFCSVFDLNTKIHSREFSLIRNSHNTISVHTDASLNLKTQHCGLGFVIISNFNKILLA